MGQRTQDTAKRHRVIKSPRQMSSNTSKLIATPTRRAKPRAISGSSPHPIAVAHCVDISFKPFEVNANFLY
jgi:hypothetical protein